MTDPHKQRTESIDTDQYEQETFHQDLEGRGMSGSPGSHGSCLLQSGVILQIPLNQQKGWLAQARPSPGDAWANCQVSEVGAESQNTHCRQARVHMLDLCSFTLVISFCCVAWGHSDYSNTCPDFCVVFNPEELETCIHFDDPKSWQDVLLLNKHMKINGDIRDPERQF